MFSCFLTSDIAEATQLLLFQNEMRTAFLLLRLPGKWGIEIRSPEGTVELQSPLAIALITVLGMLSEVSPSFSSFE